MLQIAKRIFWLVMLGLGVESVSAFSLLGPLPPSGGPDGWQQPPIGYQLPSDIGTPKNLGEEYRRNTPVMFYAMDQNFLDYFGSAGSNAIVQAFEIMNSLTNVSSYSGNLDEVPMQAQEHNYLADALQLFDLKSATLGLLVENLGLAQPDRWVWAIRIRDPGPTCPITAAYNIIGRNFDPVWSSHDQLQVSSYVNGTLYTYYIWEFCALPNPIAPRLADAMEWRVDPTADGFTAVASAFWNDVFGTGILGQDFGGFYTTLTRDDVGGLRYLLRTNNMNIEDAGPDTFTFITNTTPQLLFTSNLTLFTQQALTNDAATLQGLYPGLIITSTSPIFTNLITTNVIFYFTNSPYAPAGSPAQLVSTTVLTTNVTTYFLHTFANVRAIANDTGLVAAYDFEEGSGVTLYDASRYANNGTINGAAWTQGKHGTGLSFNGTGALVTVNNSSSLHFTNGITLEAWVSPTSVGGEREITYQDVNVFSLMGSTLTGNPGFGGSFASTNVVLGPTPLALNTWTHLASTYDGMMMRFYVNGTEVASRAQTGPVGSSSGNLSIGGDARNGRYWAGLIDEVRVYNRALSASEIWTDLNTPVVGLRSGMPVTRLADVVSFTNSPVFLLTTNVSTDVCGPYAPSGSICTNVSLTAIPGDFARGAFFIIPSNLCDVSIVSTQLIQTVIVTNLVTVATNVAGATNVGVQEFSQSLVYSYDQHVLVVRPVICPTNSTALRQGIEKITFIRRDYDSLLERFIYPITNRYILNAVTNNTVVPQTVQRVIIAPDFLMTAVDTTDAALLGARSIEFNTTNAYPGIAGPGTITRPAGLGAVGTLFTFNKVGPLYFNAFTGFYFDTSWIIAAGTNQQQVLVWGSFDGTTNTPVVYPNGTSITNLENSVLIQVSPSAPVTNGAVQLPNGTVGVDYAPVFSGFSAVGGQPPYSWDLAPGSPALPPNLVLNANGTISGAPAPATAGLTFDFVIRMTDAGARFVDRNFAITINP